MTIESLISDIHAAGFFLGNLFEHPVGRWQANLYDPEGGRYEFGRGFDPASALGDAMRKAIAGPAIPPRQAEIITDALVQSYFAEGGTLNGLDPIDLEDLGL